MSKGYRTYRGRSSKGKAVLAVLLVLIILAALSALAMQRYIAYDENGTPFFRLPERQRVAAEDGFLQEEPHRLPALIVRRLPVSSGLGFIPESE